MQLQLQQARATGVWWHTDIDQWPGKNAGETVEMGEIITYQRIILKQLE